MPEKKIVLIVEDEEPLRVLIAERLQAEGYAVHQAADGEEGLIAAKEIHPDVIVSDVIMPGKDGNQFYKELRRTEFGKSIPFIILTARPQMRDYFEVMGVDDFIEKPFNAETLIQKINAALAKKTASAPGTQESAPPVIKIQLSHKDITLAEEQEKLLKSATIDIEIQRKQKIDENEEEKEKIRTQRPKISLGTGQKRIIFWGDDMDEFCELQRRAAKFDCAAELVCNQQECVEEIRRVNPDIIIIKDQPGVVNAENAANQLKEDGSLVKVPIIVCGSIGEKEEVRKPSGQKIIGFSMNAHGQLLLDRVKKILFS